MCEKPILGLVPKCIYEETNLSNRINDILDAMKRYHENNKPIPKSWVGELDDKINKIYLYYQSRQ